MLALLGLLGLALTDPALLPPSITEGGPEPEADEPGTPSRTVPLDTTLEVDGASATERQRPRRSASRAWAAKHPT